MSTLFSQKRYSLLIGFAILTFFFIQSYREFTYEVFNQSIVRSQVGMSSLAIIAILCSPLLLYLPRIDIPLTLFATGGIIILHRLYGTLTENPSAELLIYSIVVIAYTIFLACFLTSYLKRIRPKKKQKYVAELLIATALVLLADITINAWSANFSFSQYSLMNFGNPKLANSIWLILPLSLIALYHLVITYEVFTHEYKGRYMEKPETKQNITVVVPGIFLGTGIATLLLLMGSPAAIASIVTPNLSTMVVLTSLQLLIFIWFMLDPRLLVPFFSGKNFWITTSILNGILAIVLWDIYVWHIGLSAYFFGFALWGMIFNLGSLFYEASRREFDLYHMMAMVFIGNITFILMLLFLIFVNFNPHLAPYFISLKEGVRPILFFASQLFIGGSIYFTTKNHPQYVLAQ